MGVTGAKYTIWVNSYAIAEQPHNSVLAATIAQPDAIFKLLATLYRDQHKKTI